MNSTEVNNEPYALQAWVKARMIYIKLNDGRIIGFPADRFKKLKKASENQLKAVTIELEGYALRWEELDEDLSVAGILAGNFQLPLPEKAA